MSPQSLRFGRFELQPRERRLLADGAPVALGARAFDLLLTMAAQPGQLLTKSELLDEVWPGLVVEEANLSVQVSSLRKVLGGDWIATIPGRGYRFTGTPTKDGADLALPAAMPPPGPSPSPAPQARALIGRDADLARIEAALRHPGVVTLTGPAGVGKTSLARVLAARSERGALWVDLAPLTQGEQVLAAIARALDVPLPDRDPWPTLLRALAGRLLVLDNAEHLIDATALLAAQLLQAVPGQHVLATSQQPLRVDGERVQRIGPLDLPLDSDALDLHRGAVALFVERARAADHRFQAGAGNLPLLRAICRRLDGLPLALEMAAARVPVLGLVGLRDALEERFALLTSGRRDAAAKHRTLHAALDWSYGLLAPFEQRLFRICGVFSGGFTLELLVQVASAPAGAGNEGAPESRWAVIDTLAQLVDSSLVGTDAGDPPRFALLESMRDYARQHLAGSGEEVTHRSRHAHALAVLAERADAAITDHEACAPMLAEHDNLREAIAWLLANEPATAVEMAISTARVATFSAWRREALRWLESCEGVVEGGRVPAPLRARWWRARAHQWLMNRDPRARAMAERALELHREIGDDKGEFEALGCIVRASVEPSGDLEGICAAMRALLARHPEWKMLASLSLAGVEAWASELRGDYEGYLRHRLEEYELACRMNDRVMSDAADTNVVAALSRLGRYEEALARSRTILERMVGSDSGNAAWAWQGYVGLLLVLRRFDAFRAAAPRAAVVLRKNSLPLITDMYAVLLAEEGRAHDAARMLGHARGTYAACGMAIEGAHLDNFQRAERLARAGLDEATFTELVAEGRHLDDAAADRLALGVPERVESPDERASADRDRGA